MFVLQKFCLFEKLFKLHLSTNYGFLVFFFDRQVLESGNLGKRKRLVIREKKLKCSKSKVVNFSYNFEHNYSVFKFRNSIFDGFCPEEADSFANIISTGQSQVRSDGS